MLETTTRSGTVVRTEVLRAPIEGYVEVGRHASDPHARVYEYSDGELSWASQETLLTNEIEALLHRATVRLVNAAHPGVEDFRVTRENAHVWAEGTVKA